MREWENYRRGVKEIGMQEVKKSMQKTWIKEDAKDAQICMHERVHERVHMQECSRFMQELRRIMQK